MPNTTNFEIRSGDTANTIGEDWHKYAEDRIGWRHTKIPEFVDYCFGRFGTADREEPALQKRLWSEMAEHDETAAGSGDPAVGREAGLRPRRYPFSLAPDRGRKRVLEKTRIDPYGSRPRIQ